MRSVITNVRYVSPGAFLGHVSRGLAGKNWEYDAADTSVGQGFVLASRLTSRNTRNGHFWAKFVGVKIASHATMACCSRGPCHAGATSVIGIDRRGMGNGRLLAECRRCLAYKCDGANSASCSHKYM